MELDPKDARRILAAAIKEIAEAVLKSESKDDVKALQQELKRLKARLEDLHKESP